MGVIGNMSRVNLRLFLVVAFCFIGTVAFSQMRHYRNEIKLNILTSCLLHPEINYERVISDYFEYPDYYGFGFSATASLIAPESLDPESDFADFAKMMAKICGNYQIAPYFRFYFSKFDEFFYHVGLKRPNLFFIETNLAVIGYEDRTSFGLGLAVGKKFINSMNYAAEIYFGGGAGTSDFKGIDVYLRFGINLGKRF